MSNSEDEIMIPPPPTKKVKLSSECENEDRLSDLPESVILHILSFLNTKDAVQTCVLSPIYKDLWKRLPALTLHNRDFRTFKIFTTFVSKILSLRDSSISLQSLDFQRHNGRFEPQLKKIVNYAISHNVQQLQLCVTCDIAQIPHSLFSFQPLTHLELSIVQRDKHSETEFPNSFSLPALTHLKLSAAQWDRNRKRQFLNSLSLPALTHLMLSGYSNHENLFPDSLDLPALTSLQLEHFTFCVSGNNCAEPFSTFSRLSSLLISDCTVKGKENLRISSVTLVNFTTYNFSEDYYKIELCTPSLCTWLLEFADIKSLTLTATALQVLYLFPDLLKHKHHSLGKLKSLKVEIDEILYGVRLTLCEFKLKTVKSKKEAARIKKAYASGSEPSPTVPDGIVDFLRQNSPSAEVDFVDCTRKPVRPRHL
ncbi:putative F-box domain, leucine-rich repeat domain, L domain-containing protein [Medicago truncatula]|uniref:Putative F-box domain, leucine-rich repeat domain, L domain-containing protein n=1 Tax=Medicago truncatula TaxID=3880 RepID=A0A396IT64_MEDTR|nr:putative F-box domain, leucine-rich repeat domain, L domain-containing protein [Medicago truncatula]